MKKLLLGCSLIIACTAATAGQRDFTKLDTDQDKQVSLSEFMVHIKAEKVEHMTGIFHKRDKNVDGFLSAQEYVVKNKKAAKKA
jgi:hypothetical protein